MKKVTKRTKRKSTKKKKKVFCDSCSSIATRYCPDPYQKEINGDTRNVHMCDECYQASLDEI